MIDIGKLQTHIGWLTKGLIGLSAASAIVAGWLVANLYTPMHDIATNVAVLTSQMADIKSDVSEIKASQEPKNAIQPAESPRAKTE